MFIDGKPVVFSRAKTKELFALLVDRRGYTVSVKEACAILFEDKSYGRTQGSYFRTLVSDLTRKLKKHGLEGIIRKSRNNISVNVNNFDCDAYNFIKGDPEALSEYKGDYMICYGWAKYSSGVFDRKIQDSDDKL